ncbi:MAG: zinc-binding dehydrogenase, partial [Cyclobacteriaceae bacterium]|nr:zinc-binding dehydrogenase [Cyclobacteriaceae bacterium]
EIGVDHIVNVAKDPVKVISEITEGDMATAVFDATGHKGALESGIDYMSHGGRYILVGLSKGELTFVHPKIHAKETTILCSRNATTEDFENVIEVLKSGQFPTSSFVTHSVDYTQMIEKFDSWLKPETGVIKATVNFS